ncbi:MAG: NAD-dependent epimerase/dehydratase family protein [Candidatus Sericytochromatia bacterium]|nr:NAD-dependent epimerase/dehydratase family protein [Candidatus Sericytochromatia bacterium]
MMYAIVTGAAGFIGSHLSERLVSQGWEVLGIDSFEPFYPRALKEANLAKLRQMTGFRLLEVDLVEVDWSSLLRNCQVVFHQAAQAGVRSSWGDQFGDYLHHNLLATQRLLEGVRQSPGVARVVFASSSSIYGDAESLPTLETASLQPVSPYGVTKLAAERLGFVYHRSFGVPFTALRYFTVYGPRQRPDMAFHRFMRALRTETPIDVYGDGGQTRDFTFVSDAIAANLAAATADGAVGEAFNIGGGSRVTLAEVLTTIEQVSGRTFERRTGPAQPGDARHTSADTSKAAHILGYAPQVALRDGLTAMWAWSGDLPQ